MDQVVLDLLKPSKNDFAAQVSKISTVAKVCVGKLDQILGDSGASDIGVCRAPCTVTDDEHDGAAKMARIIRSLRALRSCCRRSASNRSLRWRA